MGGKWGFCWICCKGLLMLLLVLLLLLKDGGACWGWFQLFRLVAGSGVWNWLELLSELLLAQGFTFVVPENRLVELLVWIIEANVLETP